MVYTIHSRSHWGWFIVGFATGEGLGPASCTDSLSHFGWKLICGFAVGAMQSTEAGTKHVKLWPLLVLNGLPTLDFKFGQSLPGGVWRKLGLASDEHHGWQKGWRLHRLQQDRACHSEWFEGFGTSGSILLSPLGRNASVLPFVILKGPGMSSHCYSLAAHTCQAKPSFRSGQGIWISTSHPSLDTDPNWLQKKR